MSNKELLIAFLSILLGLICSLMASLMEAPNWGSFLAFLIGISIMLNVEK